MVYLSRCAYLWMPETSCLSWLVNNELRLQTSHFGRIMRSNSTVLDSFYTNYTDYTWWQSQLWRLLSRQRSDYLSTLDSHVNLRCLNWSSGVAKVRLLILYFQITNYPDTTVWKTRICKNETRCVWSALSTVLEYFDECTTREQISCAGNREFCNICFETQIQVFQLTHATY